MSKNVYQLIHLLFFHKSFMCLYELMDNFKEMIICFIHSLIYMHNGYNNIFKMFFLFFEINKWLLMGFCSPKARFLNTVLRHFLHYCHCLAGMQMNVHFLLLILLPRHTQHMGDTTDISCSLYRKACYNMISQICYGGGFYGVAFIKAE